MHNLLPKHCDSGFAEIGHVGAIQPPLLFWWTKVRIVSSKPISEAQACQLIEGCQLQQPCWCDGGIEQVRKG